MADLPRGPRLPAWGQALAMAWQPQAFLDWCARRYGDRFTVRMGGFGAFVYLSDPDDIRALFRGDSDTFRAGEANGTVLEPVLGSTSVLVTDGTAHQRQRRLLMPAFHGEAVARQTQLMADITAAELAGWAVDRRFPVLERMRTITLEIILRTVIGARDEARLADLREALPRLVDLDRFTMLPLLFPALRERWPWRRYQDVQARADALLRAEIVRCRADPDLEQRTDALAAMVRARDDDGTALRDDELRDQLTTLLLAGHETTATGLAWALERLTRHPAVLERAQAAARQGDQAYLDAVVSETLRIRPVIPDVSRLVTRSCELRGVELPARTFVDPAITVVHRSAANYDHPLAFDPERFVGRRPDPSVWLPFGGGSRRCLGAAFATAEMGVVLRTVLEHVDLAPTTSRDERARVRHVTLVPHAGARVTVRRHHGGSQSRSQPASAEVAGAADQPTSTAV